MAIRLADERPHQPTSDPDWVEAWLFDVVHHDGSIAMSIEYLQWPQRRQVAFHASVVRSGHSLVSLVELEAEAPKPPSLEVRASGLWADVGIQTAGDHMTVDIEAFAVSLDDPQQVFAGAYGERTALGCELEWETAAEAHTAPALYEMPCVVHGELLLDDLTIEVDGWGWRSHRWGRPAPQDRTRVRGCSAAGEWFSSTEVDRELTMNVLGEAPVPDPSTNAKLLQYFTATDDGDLAWVRRVEA